MRSLLLTLCLVLALPAAAQSPFVADLEARLVASGFPAQGSEFGTSLALDGDRAIVGSIDPATNQVRVDIFVREGGDWLQEFSATFPNAIFTTVIGLDIDGGVAVVGATGGERDGIIPGIAYVYELQGGSWVQTAELSPSSLGTGAAFGASADIDDDRILIGAPTDGDPNQGAAFVFQKTGTTWTQQARLTSNDSDDNDGFGFSVALDGDRALVGAYGDDDRGQSSGSAYLFERANGQWTQTAKLRPGANADGAFFGFSASLRGDRAVVGAPIESVGGTPQVGAVYTFRQENGAWPLLERLTPAEPVTSTLYGYDVRHGDDRLAVGTIRGADVYGRSVSGWSREVSLVHPDGPNDSDGSSRFFGLSVAVSGDRVLVGARREDIPPGMDEGAAYIFDLGVFVDAEGAPSASAVSLSAPAPNPTRDRATMTLTVAAPSRAVAVLHDALGRRVAVLLDAEVGAAVRIDVPTADLAPGVYTVRVETVNGAATQRVSVVR